MGDDSGPDWAEAVVYGGRRHVRLLLRLERTIVEFRVALSDAVLDRHRDRWRIRR